MVSPETSDLSDLVEWIVELESGAVPLPYTDYHS